MLGSSDYLVNIAISFLSGVEKRIPNFPEATLRNYLSRRHGMTITQIDQAFIIYNARRGKFSKKTEKQGEEDVVEKDHKEADFWNWLHGRPLTLNQVEQAFKNHNSRLSDLKQAGDGPEVLNSKNRAKFMVDEESCKNDESVVIIDKNDTTEYFVCGICFDELPETNMVLAECDHNYCRTCLQKHWLYKIINGDVLSLKCVEPSCNREITEQQVLELCDDEVGEKFLRFRRSRLVQRENGTVKYCTLPNCDGWASGSRWKPKATCRTCGIAYCWYCNQPWHGWFSRCKKENKNVEKLYKSFKRCKDIQSCPKCHAQIWKNMGCKHMTCKICKHQFCWHCYRK